MEYGTKAEIIKGLNIIISQLKQLQKENGTIAEQNDEIIELLRELCGNVRRIGDKYVDPQ